MRCARQHDNSMGTKHIRHFRPRKRRQYPRDVDCCVLRQADFPYGCWAPLGADDWSADVTLQQRLAGVVDRCDQVTEHRLLVLRVGFTLGINHSSGGLVHQFELVGDGPRMSPRCPRCRRALRTLWMPHWRDTLQCRVCEHIRYTSRTRSSNRYHLDAARLVEQRLMVDPDNPSRVRLEDHTEQVVFVSNCEFVPKLGRGSGMLSRLFRQASPGLDSALARLRA